MKTRGAMRVILVLLAAAVAVGCSNGVTGPGGSPSDNTGGDGGALPPTLNPPPDQGEVSVTSNLAIEFASPIDPSSVTDSDFTVRRSPTYLGSMRSTGSGPTVDLVIGTLEIVGNKIIFTPDQPLAHATSYVVEITAVIKDLDGNILADGLSWTFTTEPAPDVIYVAVTGTDNGTCGLGPQTPCGTINSALDRASDEGRDTLAISEGTYDEQVGLHSGINLYGFTSEWAPTADPSLVIIQAPAVSSGEMAVAVYAENLNDATKLRALTIEAPDSVGGSGNAASSYGVYANGASGLTLEQLIIVGGQAADGTDGTDGVDADQTAAEAGGDGWNSRFHDKFALTGIAAGVGAGEGDRQGGDGGPGWAPDSGYLGSTYWYWPKPGFRGSDAAVFEESGFGSGAPAPAVAEMGLDGFDGRTINGTGGSSAVAPGEVIGDVWTVDVDDARGATGELGEDGTGGGGGSGTGGYEQAVYDGTAEYDEYEPGGYTGAGAGGGGAGGLAAPQAGTGGTSGGSVFGVFAVNSTLDITDLVLRGARAGTGGDGGAGGKGQPGGAGGQGGHMDMPEFPDVNLWGGRGGDGGDGGTSGGGGGGAGGNVYAIFSVDSTVNRSQISITDSQAGTGGQGGNGPAPGAADNGADGPDGVQKNFEQW